MVDYSTSAQSSSSKEKAFGGIELCYESMSGSDVVKYNARYWVIQTDDVATITWKMVK